MNDVVVFRRALAFLIAGVLLVCIDLRIDGWDLLPDLLGWLFQAGAVWALRRAHHDAAYEGRMTAAFVTTCVVVALAFVQRVDLNAVGRVLELASWVQPLLVAYAFLRLATVLGSRALWQDWDVKLVALLVSTAVVVAAIVLTSNAVAVLAVVTTIVAYVLYLRALLHTRSAPDRVAATMAS